MKLWRPIKSLRSKFNYKYQIVVKNGECTDTFEIVDEVNKQEYIQSHI